jgi:hypothetical protein
MTPFAQHYRARVVPRLRTEIQKVGALLALDVIDWNEAEGQVTKIADHYGARNLRGYAYDELLDWIAGRLLDAQIDAEASVEARSKALARREAADPVAYYGALAAACRDPDAVCWIFAAISPAYRAHLLAEAREHG